MTETDRATVRTAPPPGQGAFADAAIGPEAPVVDDQTAPWWQATARGDLLIRRCHACGSPSFYPRPFCPDCWSTAVAWEACSGRATLYTWSIVRVNDVPPFDQRVPYVAAMVDLVEGPRMATNLVDADLSRIRIGQDLELAFRSLPGGLALPVFRPLDEARGGAP